MGFFLDEDTTESAAQPGFFIDEEPAAAPSVTRTTTGPKSQGIMGLFAQGLPFSDEIRAAGLTAGDKLIKQPLDWMTGQNIAPQGSWGEVYDQELARARADEAQTQAEYPVASVVAPMVTAAALPNVKGGEMLAGLRAAPGVIKSGLKAAGSALEGAGWGGLFGFSEGEGGLSNRLGAAEEGATIGGVVGGGAGAVAKGIGKASTAAGGWLKEAGRKLELSAFGGTKNVIAKLNDKAKSLFDELGQYKNPLGEAIASFRSAGGGSAGMEGPVLVRELEGQTKALNQEIGKLISKAESGQVDPIVPAFSSTQKYVEGLAGVERKNAEELANDLIKKTIDNTDGSLGALQSEKEKLSQVISDTAWGDDANPIKTNILKRIRSDLRQAIESGYQALTGRPAAEIANLNAELGKRYALRKPFEDMLASGESRDMLRSMIQGVRTSGGAGQTMIAAAAGLGAGGLPLGAALALGSMAAQTPQGKKAIADTFRSAALQKTASTIGKAGQIASDLAPRVGGALSRQDAAESPASRYEPPKREPQNTRSQSGQTGEFPFLNSTTAKPATQNGLLGAARAIFGAQPSIFNAKKKDTQVKQEPKAEAQEAMLPDVTEFEPLVKAVISQESGGKPGAVSDKGAMGLMQLMPATAKEIAKELGIGDPDLKDPQTNILLGSYYLKKLLRQFGGDVELALTAYHSGPNRVKNLLARANGSKLEDIKKYLGPVGQKYAMQVLDRMKA